MPIYEYQCQACGHQFEKLQKISDEPVKICPKCQEPSAQRLVSAAGFQLKGTGWYVTDFRDGDKKKPTSETKGEKSSKKVDTTAKSNSSADS